MDELLIKYCKENGYIYVDYSYKLNEYKHEETKKYLEKLLTNISCNEKYKKCIIRINFDIIHYKIHYMLNRTIKNILNLNLKDDYTSNKSVFIYRKHLIFSKNDEIFNEFSIKKIFEIEDIEENKSCCICLENVNKNYISCINCSAYYHKECLHNKNYPLNYNNNKLCSICRKIV